MLVDSFERMGKHSQQLLVVRTAQQEYEIMFGTHKCHLQ